MIKKIIAFVTGLEGENLELATDIASWCLLFLLVVSILGLIANTLSPGCPTPAG